MGWLTSGLRAVSSVARSPIVSGAVGLIPGGGLVKAGLGIGAAALATAGASKLLGGGSGGYTGNQGLPPMPGGIPPQRPGGMNIIPGWRGAGGGLQMPWNDPSVMAGFKQGEYGSPVLDDQWLRPYFKAPRGYVVVRDPSGRPYPMRRDIAIAQKMWRPGKKPPISVGDWQKLAGASRVIDKLKTMESRAKKIANFHAPKARTKEVFLEQATDGHFKRLKKAA